MGAYDMNWLVIKEKSYSELEHKKVLLNNNKEKKTWLKAERCD